MYLNQPSNTKYMLQAEVGYTIQSAINFLAVIVVLTVSLLADVILSVDIPHAMGYVLAIILSVLLSNSYRLLWTTTAIALALIVFGGWIAFLLQAEFVLRDQVITRSVSAAAILLAGMLCQLQLNSREVVSRKLQILEDSKIDFVASTKQMERSLAESQTGFQCMADALPGMVWAASRDGRLEYLNDASKRYFGMEEATIPSNALLKDYVHPADRQSVTQRWFRAVRRGDEGFSAKIRMKNWEGHYNWHQLNALAHSRIEDNRPVTQWFGMATNVDNMVQTQMRFKDMAHLFDRTFDSITDMLFTVGPDWTFQTLNSRAARFFGGTRQSLIGRPFFEVGVAILGMATVHELRKVQHRNNLKPFEFYSEELNASLRCSAYSLDEGKGFVFYIQDVTEQRLLEKQLQKAQQLETLGMLTGGIAHDFNNLLTVIMGNAEMMTRKLDNDEMLAQRAQTIQLAATKGAALVQQLLAYARKQPLHPEIVDVNRLIGDIGSLLHKSVTEAVKIRYELGTDVWFANIDPFQLESALLNLSINAMQAMPNGGKILIETLNETIGNDRAASILEFNPGDYITISVSDNGTGIPKQDLGKVFEPFYTTKDTGTGLGLSMVYGFVKQSGGHITVYSEKDQGTTFRLYLPKAAKQVNVIEIPQKQPICCNNGTESILVVEDDDLVRDYANTVLEQAGYQVFKAEDGQEALRFLENHPDKIDLLFTDIILPGGMYGTELAKRAAETRPDMKILFSSGYSKTMLEFNQQTAAASDHIKKPYQRSALLAQLREILDSADTSILEAVVA